ncbi:MAG: AbrB/MazE/SpoVT family DNA-binding domain-containing protein [Anaerolineales bacterium]|nr:AbrB/MazE/SpoVT family DNA-binding domain-containing protein [Anaerolineales bacterium]
MVTHIQKWGNSLALRIPQAVAREIGLDKDSSVEIALTDGKLVIAPVVKRKLTLAKLLAQVTDENIHREIDTGASIGRELW